MIITVTLNPAIDKTIEIEGFKEGGLNKVIISHQDPGGKGINVSKVVQSLGGTSVATGLLASTYIEKALSDMNIEHDFVQIGGSTRTNLKVFDRKSGETTEINEPGPDVTMTEIDKLLEKIAGHATRGDMVILSGSAPASLPREVYKIMIEKLKAQGLMTFLDAEGELFKQALLGKPDIIKPNRHELELYFGRTLDSKEALVVAAHHFIDLGIGKVFISLGSEGAFYADSENNYFLNPLKIKAHSSVGAGDAFVGAVAYGIEKEMVLEECLKLAVATSAGAVVTVGTKPMNKDWVFENMKEVQLTAL